MIKYTEFTIVFEEIPNKITLAVNISNCLCNCKGCHTPKLRKNVGDELTEEVVNNVFDKYIKDCNCFLFLGEGNDKQALFNINQYIKSKYHIETALYSGRDAIENDIWEDFDYVKIGRYDEKFGHLQMETTNQRLYYKKEDITHLFWKK
jgi:anaerobic ribonucleoside-triphosphate reductase activating protein